MARPRDRNPTKVHARRQRPVRSIDSKVVYELANGGEKEFETRTETFSKNLPWNEYPFDGTDFFSLHLPAMYKLRNRIKPRKLSSISGRMINLNHWCLEKFNFPIIF